MRSCIYTTSPTSSPPSQLPTRTTFVTVALVSLHFSLLAAAVPGNLILDYSPAPPPDSPLSPPGAENILRDKAYLPAQIGGIVGAYAFSLVLVAAALLLLSKRRKEHFDGIDAINDEDELIFPFSHSPQTSRDFVPNFSYPSPSRGEFPKTWIDPVSPTSEVSACAPGVDIHVDQRVVEQDKTMAQQQLEDMYRYVMEHEEAKEKGITLKDPVLPADPSCNTVSGAKSAQSTGSSKKDKHKPSGLSLQKDDKKTSRASSFFNALRSPRKKNSQVKGFNISSPLMTPMSGRFPPQHETEEMNPISPRHYAPALPPPVPADKASLGTKKTAAPLTPDQSPESTMSIDERLRGQLPLREQGQGDAARNGHPQSTAAVVPSEGDQALSAVSERSTSPLVGLPSSPKPGVTSFPALPQSPKPGQSFSRQNAPSALRTGGALPLRAYQPSITSPSMSSFQTKQTVFERTGPLSPGMKSPFTGTAVPYSPYQPQTPCVPMTPALVTKADRRRQRKLEPKTPTLHMVKSDDEIW